jgi:dTDP-3-amino-3,4,6-trideoxy-alpha-D-glucose transaminase
LSPANVQVPLARLDNADPDLMQELLAAVDGVARTASFILGAEVEGFETEFADYCGTTEAIGVGSGTDALALSLLALGVGPGDEVIVPANSFVASAEAVSLAGATPRLVDVDPDTHLLTPELAAAAIGPRTAAMIPVHLYGRTADMDPLLEVARRAGIAVVEDACQAHGAWYRGRRVGSLGDAGCFSFYPAKNLGAWGDGGAVVTSDPELARRVRLLRAHGESPRYHHRIRGTTSRLDAIQAAVLRVKLRRLDEWNERRRRAAWTLAASLAGSSVRRPAPPPRDGDHVFHQFVVESERRDDLRQHLEACGVASGIHYPVPIHRSEAYADLGLGPGSLPVSEGLAGRICSLPISPYLSDEEIARVASSVAGFAPLAHEEAA